MNEKYEAVKMGERKAKRLNSLFNALLSVGNLTLADKAELEDMFLDPDSKEFKEMADACGEPLGSIYDAKKMVAFFKKRGIRV
jgi:hypothetical protein